MDDYYKHIKRLNKYITIKNTQDILKECLGIEKDEGNIEKINTDYSSTNIAYFLNNKIKKYLSINKDINFKHRYSELRSYYDQDENKIVYDEMFFQLIMSFYLMIFDWVYHDKEKNQEIYFNQLFYILNQSAIKHQTIHSDNFVEIIQRFDDNIIEIICCLGVCSEMFIILHELAHVYLNHQINNHSYLSQELEADKIAFNILVEMIDEQNQNKNINFDCFENYCIIVPIILFEMFETINKTSQYKYNKQFIKDIDSIKKRKEQIFNLIDKCNIDTNNAVNIYGYVTYIIDKYSNELEQLELELIEENIKKNFIKIEKIHSKSEIKENILEFIIIKDDDKPKGWYIDPQNIIIINIKKCLEWLLETYLCNVLVSIDNSVKLFLYLFYTTLKLSTVDLDDNECRIIMIMHSHNYYESNYDQGIPKNKFEDYIKKEIEKNYHIVISNEDVKKLKEKMLKNKILSSYRNKIYIRDYVFIKQ